MNPGTDPLPGVDRPAAPARRSKLLVVDDEPANVQALYRVFAQDHQVLMATGGEQALSVCAAQQPDLVLLDVEMSGLDGYEVCRRLKADAATAAIPVIFVTAHASVEAEARGLEAGAVDFISKPVHPPIVRARVRTHLLLKAQSDLLRSWAFIDGLTGVHNRRHFDAQLAVEHARARRSHSPLSVLLIDVDHFKRFNDRHGHQAGDECLRRVAMAIAAQLLRPGDLLTRYGGEEFACLLPDTDQAGARVCAERIGRCVHDLGIAHGASPTAAVVTVSVGACTVVPDASAQASELLRGADEQLYNAKASGRNQVCGVALNPA